ncbi:hypothetical protein HYT57_00975 [Candidatus Woesearchaeota archaeon]|nr:hypothetical protein [Candidatus Woesearchaeota archaeon]
MEHPNISSTLRKIFLSQNYRRYKNIKIPDVKEFVEYCNSNEADEEKSVQLLFTLIILDKKRKYQTAKNLLKAFLKSDISVQSKKEIAEFIINGYYFGSLLDLLPEEKVKEKRKEYSNFMIKVVEKLNVIAEEYETLSGTFNFVAREAMYWLIDNSSNPKKEINKRLKEKVDWMDLTVQNGILDYCYNNEKKLGREFVMGIFEKAIKVNMREVRLVAFKCVYLLTQDDKYLKMIENDPSGYIRRKIGVIKHEAANKNPAFG